MRDTQQKLIDGVAVRCLCLVFLDPVPNHNWFCSSHLYGYRRSLVSRSARGNLLVGVLLKLAWLVSVPAKKIPSSVLALPTREVHLHLSREANEGCRAAPPLSSLRCEMAKTVDCHSGIALVLTRSVFLETFLR